MKEFLSQININSNIAIFSTTIIAKYLFQLIKQKRPDIQVECFIDSYKEGSFENIKILSPQDAIKAGNISYYVIASYSNAELLENILKSLKAKNIIKLSAEDIEEIDNQIAQATKSIFERYPAGHYYSAVPSQNDLNEFLKNKNDNLLEFGGINVNISKQLENLAYIEKTFNEINFTEEKNSKDLYFLNNIWFHPYDAYTLAAIILKNKPEKIIEIGSGFSTGVMLDINRKFCNNNIKITCIEPNPQRLKDVLGGELERVSFYEKRLQEVDCEIFKELKENDILFVDSSHVAKMNSDVLKIFFEILPNLNNGVIIHFHDIFNNFSYPKEWIIQKRCWNETFLLRAFLQYNNAFVIEYFCDFMRAYIEQNRFQTKIPINKGSGSIYLRKIS